MALSAAGGVRAGDAESLDWSAWQRLPAFIEGRVLPLDTFARETVEAICGSANPTLIMPDGQSRNFTASELLFSWLVEPETWERVPFLAAQQKQLRENVLQLPQSDASGRRLRYASPVDVENSAELGRRWAELADRAEAEGKQLQLSTVDKKIKELVDAYGKYRQLTFNPQSPGDTSRRFFSRVRLSIDAWRKLAGALQRGNRLADDGPTRQAMVQAGEALQQLVSQVHGKEFSLKKTETPVAAFRGAAEKLADRLASADDKVLGSMAAELRRQTIEMHLALYDNGETLRLAPALNPAALEENREPGDDAQPWLGVQAMLLGSDDLLRGYPQPELKAVRAAFAEAKAAYVDRGAADRAEKFAAAQDRFAAAMRAFGEQIEPLRGKLPIQYRDQDLIDVTAYPPLGATDAEVFYNRLDPFFWAWSVSLAAMLCLLLSFGVLRKPTFWLGVAVLASAQAFTIAGFALRTYITSLVPLTGMFETVVFVALCVALLGLWFALTPLLWPGLQTAWRLTRVGCVLARTRESPPAGAWVQAPTLQALRVVLMVLVFLVLARWPNSFGLGIFDLWPASALGATMPSANDVLVWLCGLCILAAAVYVLPRFAVTACAAGFTIPLAWAKGGNAAAIEEVLKRRYFVLGGAALSCLAVVLACYAPATVMHRGIGSAMPILRDNFWLAVHVVTIMTSYAAAAIALILGNVALGYYLFGRYRDRRPPETCAVVAGFTYTAIQITVLLLTAGTILGALWGDKAWGRFWGWDPKEVWALVSLLVYILILHARYVGWSGDFGMAVAAVLGFTAVLWTYYGVNFIMNTGMHSYGTGSGGQWEVGGAVALNWLFLAAAASRYMTETWRGWQRRRYDGG